jgi:hypothetical protein
MTQLHDAGVSEVVQRKGSLLRTIRAVAWSFFGVRKARDLERDARELNPVHVVIVGVVAAALFVVVLVVLVNWIIASGVAA